jgi:tetratricopeptide (TPR) repeat protein
LLEAECRAQLRQTAELAGALARLEQLNAVHPRVLCLRARLLELEGDSNAAIALLENSNARAPSMWMSAALADLYRKARRYSQANEAIDAALFDSPTQPLFHRIRFELDLAQGRFDAAARSAEHARRWSPDDYQVWSYSIRSNIARGNVKAAVAALSADIAGRHRHPILAAELACEIYWRSRDRAKFFEAVAAWRSLLESPAGTEAPIYASPDLRAAQVAYWCKDLRKLERQLSTLTGDERQQAAAWLQTLHLEDRRRSSQRLFMTGLAVAAALLVALWWWSARRRRPSTSRRGGKDSA